MKAALRWLTLATIVAVSGSAWGKARVWALDGRGTLRPAGEARASLQRTPPSRFSGIPGARHGDPDALSYLIESSDAAEVPGVVSIRSLAPDGSLVAELDGVALAALPCPKPLARSALCAVTAPIRAVADDIDARHPTSRQRSIEAQLGGALLLTSMQGVTFAAVRVAGPRDTPAGPIERFRARIRFLFVRLSPGGALPVGGDADGARTVAREALARANALWGGCGISFGPAAELSVELVDPPPAHLLAVGCDHGLPASGGALHVVVNGQSLVTTIEAGMTPSEAARRVAATMKRAGLRVTVSDNPRIAAGADGSSDLLVRRANGELAELSAPAATALSSDATLTACIGRVSLEDGLQHFGDVDAMVGTVEERALVKAYDDHDPTTIDVFILPGFARGGRIGESFISADRGPLRNVVLVDRAGIRSNQASFTLAHEIGHVLLDDPGHPDDRGVDTPTRLMDADASDASAFGPRRLSVEECARALRQSGPKSPVPLLQSWPLTPLPVAKPPAVIPAVAGG